jgi:hypothetical protein
MLFPNSKLIIFSLIRKGSDDIDNLQTLCMLCNRGKGNNEYLNQTIQDKINVLLDSINPRIQNEIKMNGEAKVVANDIDYKELERLNGLCKAYNLNVIPNSIFGYQAMYNAGIYTIHDNHAGKVNFIIIKI